MKVNDILHILRNPWGHSEERVREARLAAADEIERLHRETNCGYRPLPDKRTGTPMPPGAE